MAIRTDELTPLQQRYLEICEFGRDFAPRSIECYASVLRCFNRFIATQKPGPDLSVDLILEYVAFMKKTRGFGTSHIYNQIGVIKGYTQWLFQNGEIKEWPFATGEIRIKPPRFNPRPLKRSQILTFLKHTVGPKEWLDNNGETTLPRSALVDRSLTTNLSIKLLLATGMRVGEVTNIKLEDVRENGAHIRVHGKGSLKRSVFIANPMLLEEIRLYLAGRTSTRFDHPYLLLNQYGRRLRYWTLGKHIQRIRGEIGDCDGVTAHRIRHSTASFMFERGADLLTIQRLLGHSNINTTQIYTRVSDEKLKRTLTETDPLDLATP